MADASCEPRVDAELPDTLWDRVMQATDEFATDRERAPGLLAELLGESAAVRERMAANVCRFRSLALGALLVERSLERKAAGADLAELALAIFGVLDEARYTGAVEQAKARAWGALANAYRLQGDFERADRALRRAAYHVAVAPDLLEEAWFYRLRARVRRDEGRLGRAVVLQMKAVERLAAQARPRFIAEALVELSALHLAAADRPRTIAALLAAADALGGDEEGELAGCAVGCLAGREG
jgi:tetratricopeptide (TPR) repeat protein